jgi:hypothetical protein
MWLLYLHGIEILLGWHVVVNITHYHATFLVARTRGLVVLNYVLVVGIVILGVFVEYLELVLILLVLLCVHEDVASFFIQTCLSTFLIIVFFIIAILQNVIP